MSKLIEVTGVVAWTLALLALYVVVGAVVLLPLTWAADRLLGSRYEVLAHPRRNALVLGAALVVVAILLTFAPSKRIDGAVTIDDQQDNGQDAG